jgi:DeoR family glycerol-3-phosphate regulon repressor
MQDRWYPGRRFHQFERTAPVRIGHLEQVDTFVTDHCPDAAIRNICGEFDVELIETTRPAIGG